LLRISVLVWGGVLEKLLPLSSLEGNNLVRISKSLLPGSAVLFIEGSFLCHLERCYTSVLSFLDSKVAAERMA
jgi:hypothetical protein